MSGPRAKPLQKNLASGDWIEVSRIQAARQQLDAAVGLYFISDDAVSRHTLLFAVIGILNPMLQARGGPDLLLADKVSPEYRDAWLATFKESSNFFKHGKRDGDPNETVHFRPSLDEMSLCAAIEGYGKFAERLTENMTLFIWWMRRKNPNLYSLPLTETEKQLVERFSDNQKVEYFRYCKWILSPECRGESPKEVNELSEVEASILLRTCPVDTGKPLQAGKING